MTVAFSRALRGIAQSAAAASRHGMQHTSISTQRKPLALLWDAHNRAWVAGVLQVGCSSGVRPLATAAVALEASPAAEMSVDARSKRATRVPRKKRDVMTVSEAAAKRIKELVEEKDPQPHGIRLGVRTRGCNGLSYTLNYVDEPPKLDDCVDADGVKVYVDPKAVMYLVGSRMDFVEDAVKAEFVFENPNAKGACGCGESFNV